MYKTSWFDLAEHLKGGYLNGAIIPYPQILWLGGFVLVALGEGFQNMHLGKVLRQDIQISPYSMGHVAMIACSVKIGIIAISLHN